MSSRLDINFKETLSPLFLANFLLGMRASQSGILFRILVAKHTKTLSCLKPLAYDSSQSTC